MWQPFAPFDLKVKSMNIIPVPLVARSLPSRRHRVEWGGPHHQPNGRVGRIRWFGETCSKGTKTPRFHLRFYGQIHGSGQIQETIYR